MGAEYQKHISYTYDPDVELLSQTRPGSGPATIGASLAEITKLILAAFERSSPRLAEPYQKAAYDLLGGKNDDGR